MPQPKEDFEHLAPILGRLIPVLHPRKRLFEWVKVPMIVAVFMGWHVRRGHIEAPWTRTLPIRDDRVYARTLDGVYELDAQSFRDVMERLPPDIFWPAFGTLLVDVKKVLRVDYCNSDEELERTTLVKRVAFHVEPIGDDRVVEEWITLNREAMQRFTAYFRGRAAKRRPTSTDQPH